ncbi:MAG: hypothetical protein K0S74_1136 [Chlamydiales bacterium]|jgi:hypothetical protein|nr:hypothetical protein [Chlamydiales bacterium]
MGSIIPYSSETITIENPPIDSNVLVEQAAHMIQVLSTVDATVGEEVNLLVEQFKKSMQEQNKLYELVLKKNEQLKIENARLKARPEQIKRASQAEAQSLQQRIRQQESYINTLESNHRQKKNSCENKIADLTNRIEQRRAAVNQRRAERELQRALPQECSIM